VDRAVELASEAANKALIPTIKWTLFLNINILNTHAGTYTIQLSPYKIAMKNTIGLHPGRPH